VNRNIFLVYEKKFAAYIILQIKKIKDLVWASKTG